MDPLSQGVVGMTVTQANAKASHRISASILGFLSGMAADLDVLIQSKTDPLLALEYHRHFTHSLIFIPVGALICAFVLHWLGFRKRLSFLSVYLYCFIGYATHALLDSCTTYGTQLFWPFSNYRVAWNNVSVVDPLFTLPVLALALIALWRGSRILSWSAVIYGLAYLGFGVVQHDRALEEAKLLAESRGHKPLRIETKPSFGNIILWKSVYEYDGRFYVDGIRALLDTQVYPGDSIAKLNIDEQLPWLDRQSQQARDIKRFRWFSKDYLAIDPADDLLVIDIRYSALPQQIMGLWGIRLDPQATADQYVTYEHRTDDTEAFRQGLSDLMAMILSPNKKTSIQ